jgi:hypothetical protein
MNKISEEAWIYKQQIGVPAKSEIRRHGIYKMSACEIRHATVPVPFPKEVAYFVYPY